LTINNDGISGSCNEATAPIKCRQVVCLRMVPLLISQKKKNSCKIMSFAWMMRAWHVLSRKQSKHDLLIIGKVHLI
jgi:hypothetical protein